MQLKCEGYYDATYICKIGHFGAKYGYYVIFELAKHTKGMFGKSPAPSFHESASKAGPNDPAPRSWLP